MQISDSVCRIAIAAGLATAVPLAPPSSAEVAVQGVTDSTFGASERRRALDAIEAEIAKNYVYPDKRAAVAERLEAAEKAGRYDASSPVEFAQRVSEDFLAVTHDTHLYLRFEPAWFRAAGNAPPPGEAERQNAIEDQIAHQTNHGLTEMKILPGNIRYLKIDGFDWIEDETGPAYDAAMQFLKGGAAVIIDLRGNGGGWVESSKYLISHFLPANTLIATFYSPDKPPEQYRSVDYLPAGRLTGRPLYVLIDGHSRSAAEMVAYTVQQYRLGKLVGATTQGAANISDDFPIAPGFRMSVSVGRTVQPISKTDWEGVGVAPDIAVDPAKALQTAALSAIDRLLPSAPKGIVRNELAWARPAAEAALAPVALTPRELKGFAATYGDASLRMRDGALWLYRKDRDPRRLTPMTRNGLFQSVDDPMMRIFVNRDGLDVLSIDPTHSRHYAGDPPTR